MERRQEIKLASGVASGLVVAAPGVAPADYAAPKAVADRLFAAWKGGDKRAASNVATQDAVSELFGYGYSATDRFAGCDQDQIGHVICSYNFAQGYLQFYLDGVNGTWTVTGVRADTE